MAYPNKDAPSPEFKPAEFGDAIQLKAFQRKRTVPRMYSDIIMSDPEKQYHHDAASRAESTTKEVAKLEHKEYVKTELSYPCTAEDILYEHVLYRRRQRSEKYHEYEGDIVVDWCISITKTITGVFLVFMILYTAVKWWSLGPHYAKSYQESEARLSSSVHAT